jgi:hypothetical protein
MPEFSYLIDDSVSNIKKAIVWVHYKDMRGVFILGARLKKPMKVVYYNNELMAVFKEMEAEIEAKRKLETELQSKKRIKNKRRRKPT